LIIWYFSLENLSNFWQSLTFSLRSNCDILYFCRPQTTALHNRDSLSESTARRQLLLAGTRHHLVAPRTRCTA
jgi:hypothetical protein